ncbi:unnamed protein product [Arabidopsis halleri]
MRHFVISTHFLLESFTLLPSNHILYSNILHPLFSHSFLLFLSPRILSFFIPLFPFLLLSKF